MTDCAHFVALNDDGEIALQTESLRKEYPGVVAVDAFDFKLKRGEVRALLGKNGAGKSTFCEILSGTVAPDEGTIGVAGTIRRFTDPVDAARAGIATVHQDLRLFPDLSVRENITLGRCASRGIVSRRRQEFEANEALERLGASIDISKIVRELSNRDQQLVAIGRALLSDPRVLILDEPTSALHTGEIEQLISLVRRLSHMGVASIYVSHRLDEIPKVADTVTIVRDGRVVADERISDISGDEIVETMLGKTLFETVKSHSTKRPEVALATASLTNRTLQNIDLNLHSGEILGLWGMPGSGRTELLRALFGLDRLDSGSIKINDEPKRFATPIDAIRSGLGLSPEDRKSSGLVHSMSVVENLTIASPGRISQWGVVSQKRQWALADEAINRLSIKVPVRSADVETLSGGNQQKVVIGKWLSAGARILLLDEPTQGIDVEAKATIYALLRNLAGEGMAVIFAATEVQELSLVCDRVLVLRRGKVVLNRHIEETNPGELMAASMGAIN